MPQKVGQLRWLHLLYGLHSPHGHPPQAADVEAEPGTEICGGRNILRMAIFHETANIPDRL
jgi:hypothetical protein